MKKIAITISFVLIGVLVLFAGGPYKITKIRPDKKILIGKKWCGLGDVFYETQVVHWDSKLAQQAFEADDVNNPSLTISMSKERVRKQSSSDISYKALCSLIGKGDNDYKMLWPGDSIKIVVKADTSYIYKLHIEGMYRYKDLLLQDSLIFIKPEMFDTLSGSVKFDIVRMKGYDIEIIKNEEVELIK